MKKEKVKARNSNPAGEFTEAAKEIKVFQSPEGRAYGVIKVGAHKEIWTLDSNQFKRALEKRYFEKHGSLPKRQLFNQMMGTLEFRAREVKKNVYLRMARIGDAIYIDMGDTRWRQIKVTKKGWKILHRSKVLFRRTDGMGRLPIPKEVVNGAKVLDRLRGFINTSKTDQTLILGWTAGALNPDGPFPILVVLGEPGSGKSTLVKMIKSLIDPGAAPLRGLPKNSHDLILAAHNTWAIAFDNVSTIPLWLSNDFCRLSTGGGMTTRKLYHDDVETIFDARRPLIIDGISNMIVKGDLADRVIFVTMKPIDEKEIKTEKAILAEFNKIKWLLLGAFLNGLSRSLRDEHKVKATIPSRMADFANSVIAAGTAIFHSEDEFAKAFARNQNNKSQRMVEIDVVGAEVLNLIEQISTRWSGSATFLLEQLEAQSDARKDRLIKDKAWPKSANALSARLRELSPHFRKIGYEIQFSRKSRTREISIRRLKEERVE